MVKAARFDSNGLKKGGWSIQEDNLLRSHIQRFGHPNWRLLPLLAGLARCGKSCRLRWMNYLQPGLKRGKITKHEEELIINLHNQFGNKWSTIAANLPGRTDNEIKNHWHAHIKKRSKRNSGATSAEMSEEQSSSASINYCVTKENPKNDDDQEDACSIIEPYDDQTCMSQLKTAELSSFTEEADFFDFELYRNDYMSEFSDSSDDGRIYWSPNSVEIRECNQPVEEDTFNVVLW